MQKKNIILVGAGGHGKVIADMIEKGGAFTIRGFIDDSRTGTVFGYPILGTTKDLVTLRSPTCVDAVVCIGKNTLRRDLHELVRSAQFHLATIVHPQASIARGAVLGDGSVVMPGAVIGPDVQGGEGCIINTCASVDHDCTLGAFVHIAPDAHLAGTVRVGDASFVGMGSVVREGTTIGASVTVGAASAVLDDVADGVTVYGVPAVVRKTS
jgi:sugar O-acyltransferase (sialic acid O-acetyltransferase NeuD family)